MNNDLISRSALLKNAYSSGMWNRETQKFDLKVVDVDDVINTQAVDAVEVVRCKDCLNCGIKAAVKYDGYRDDVRLCILHGIPVLPDDYCSGGAKMDVEVER